MTTILALPKVLPKPTKTEILNALVERARVKFQTENERREKRQSEIAEKILRLAAKELASKKPKPSEHNFYSYRAEATCELSFSITTPEISKLVKEHDAIKSLYWDEVSVKRNIRNGMLGIDPAAPNRLLENPQTVKALDAILA